MPLSVSCGASLWCPDASTLPEARPALSFKAWSWDFPGPGPSSVEAVSARGGPCGWTGWRGAGLREHRALGAGWTERLSERSGAGVQAPSSQP